MTPGSTEEACDFASAPEGGIAHLPGMPQDRLAHVAARRSFEELQAHFVKALSELKSPQAAPLMLQVQQTSEPVDLWLLRGPVLAALRREARQIAETRLHLQLNRMFAGDGVPFSPPVSR